jgi:uncharacterized membrane protein YeaQ/YmgE (transglycosylase-associated protein family)
MARRIGVGLLIWIIVSLIAGWLAGQVMKRGGYGVVVDVILAFSEVRCSDSWASGLAAAQLDQSSWHSLER